ALRRQVGVGRAEVEVERRLGHGRSSGCRRLGGDLGRFFVTQATVADQQQGEQRTHERQAATDEQDDRETVGEALARGVNDRRGGARGEAAGGGRLRQAPRAGGAHAREEVP